MKFSLPPFWEHFKLPHEFIEQQVGERPGSYQGLSFEALYSSRADYLRLFEHPLVQGTFVDLGCGAGEGCLLYGALFPERQAVGVEFEESRLRYGQEFAEQYKLSNVKLFKSDLLNGEIPVGDTYFLYFPTGMVLDRILHVLYHRQKKFTLLAIESHGDLLPRLGRENWLEHKGSIPLSSQRHHSEANIYQRNFKERCSSLISFDLSFQDYYLFIEENGERWIGNARGLEWTAEDRFELLTPPRTINWKCVVKYSSWEELTPQEKRLIGLRELGEVLVMTKNRSISGIIRKIFVGPTFSLEFSTGEKVQWDEILTIKQGSKVCYVSS